MKDWKRQRDRIKAVARKWRSTLGMYEWEIFTQYVDGDLLIDGTLSSTAAACANTIWEYKRATLKFNLKAVADMSDTELERVYIHEVMHVIVNEMREEDEKHEERVCTMLANAFMRTKEKPCH